MDGVYGVEEVRQADAVGFRDEAKEGAVCGKLPGTFILDKRKRLLILPVDQPGAEVSLCRFVG
jgi:hypothetical protein